ncbi:DEAD/DEAH box helicase family protein [Thermofilum pendens]|uniref:DNA 3'-5' helicase n=1 Tax=Thermofilum pendens (strain DSM 2475 / Hrk 5) TaxID=368408 RepID=A1S1E0_THEPD|nr:DEAD/DEAH box helicase family protein [Thermofilum pendens]ABL79270.1 DEAD/DEAH box helicase domain protein [Thermofilum pendens Hrk 5]
MREKKAWGAIGKEVSPDSNPLSAYNSEVERLRLAIRRNRDLAPSLEFEIARAIASRLALIRAKGLDTQEIVNDICDAVDSSLSLGENLAIVEKILAKWLGGAYYSDNNSPEEVEAQYNSWLESRLAVLADKVELGEASPEEIEEAKQILAQNPRLKDKYAELAQKLGVEQYVDWRQILAPQAISELELTEEEASTQIILGVDTSIWGYELLADLAGDEERLKELLREQGLTERDYTARVLSERIRKIRVAKIVVPKKMRDYQRIALRWLLSAHGAVQIPTGGGKTLIGSTLAVNLALWGYDTAIIVPTQVLAEQWASHFEREWRLRVNVKYGGVNRRGQGLGELITVMVYNTFVSEVKRGYTPFAVIVDESHHAGARELARTLARLARLGVHIYGFSATHKREDTEEQWVLDMLLPKRYEVSPSELQEQGYMVPIELVGIRVTETQEFYQQYEEIQEKIRRLSRRIEDGEKHLKKDLMKLVNLRKQLAARSPVKWSSALALINRLAQEHNRVLVWTESQDVALKLAQTLGGKAILSKTPKTERARILKEWGSTFRVLVTCRVLDEGVDVPEVSVGVMLASGTTDRQLIQRAGRLLRPAPGKTKATLFYVYVAYTHEETAFHKLKAIFARRGLQ